MAAYCPNHSGTSATDEVVTRLSTCTSSCTPLKTMRLNCPLSKRAAMINSLVISSCLDGLYNVSANEFVSESVCTRYSVCKYSLSESLVHHTTTATITKIATDTLINNCLNKDIAGSYGLNPSRRIFSSRLRQRPILSTDRGA